MKLRTALMLLASAGYLPIVLSFALIDNFGGANELNDGYVNATTVNVPTTRTTQVFDKRQSQQALAYAIYAVKGISNLLNVGRDQTTQQVVQILYDANPHYNYVMCHVNHNYNFKGQQGVDWDHMEISMSEARFDVIVGGAGTFIRIGDGGYINWAYIGNVASRTDNIGADGTPSSTVVFNAP